MKNLSITQSYMLCALNENGKFPTFHSEIPICLVAGAVIDLVQGNYVRLENKRLSVIAPLDEAMQHLQPVYHFIANKEKVKLETLASEYCFTFTDQHFNALYDNVGATLCRARFASCKQGGLFGKKQYYIPGADAVDYVVQNLRAEILEDGTMSDEITALACLLEQSGLLKKYFSSYEKKLLRARIKELKNDPSHKIVSELLDTITVMIAVIAAGSSAN